MESFCLDLLLLVICLLVWFCFCNASDRSQILYALPESYLVHFFSDPLADFIERVKNTVGNMQKVKQDQRIWPFRMIQLRRGEMGI